MLVLSESINLPVLEEDRYYIMKDNIPYGIDKNGKEYEITPSMVNDYYNKYGGRWKMKAKMAAGHLLGGALIGVPMMVGNDIITRPLGSTASNVASGIGMVTGTLYGRMKGIEHENNRIYNDIVRKRQTGEF